MSGTDAAGFIHQENCVCSLDCGCDALCDGQCLERAPCLWMLPHGSSCGSRDLSITVSPDPSKRFTEEIAGYILPRRQ